MQAGDRDGEHTLLIPLRGEERPALRCRLIWESLEHRLLCVGGHFSSMCCTKKGCLVCPRWALEARVALISSGQGSFTVLFYKMEKITPHWPPEG